jgi:hypothetical protein
MPAFRFISVLEALLFNFVRFKVSRRKENVRERHYQCSFNVATLLRNLYGFHISHRLPLESRTNENFTRVNVETAFRLPNAQPVIIALFLPAQLAPKFCGF